MPNIFSGFSSIHGRRVVISSSGAICDREGYAAGMIDSSGVRQTPAKSYVEAISSSGAVLASSGLSYFSSATSTARNFNLYGPSSGQDKELFSLSSATTMVVETSVSGVYFVTTGAESTALTFSAATGTKGERVILRGLSSSRWAILSKTAGVS